MGSYFNKLPKATIQGTTNQFNMGAVQFFCSWVCGDNTERRVSIEQTPLTILQNLSLMPISILMFSILLITLLPVIMSLSRKEQEDIRFTYVIDKVYLMY